MLMVIAVVVLLLGYRFIDQVLGRGCDVERLEFQHSLERMLKRYSAYGSLQRPTLQAPCGAQLLCFVDATQIDADPGKEGYEGNGSFSYSNNPIIEAAVKSPSQSRPANIFLVSDKATEPVGYNEKIRLETGSILCVEARGRGFALEMHGQGRTVLLKGRA